MLFGMTIVVLAASWAMVIALYSLSEQRNVLRLVRPRIIETSDERDERRGREESDLRENLQTIGTTLDANGDAPTLLAELGIAENRTVLDYDDRHELKGDMWLCSGRPLWFALIQLLPTWAIASLASYTLNISPTACAVIGVGVTALLLLPFSAVVVEENTRLGVKRFRRQTEGYLGPGLQFLIPFIERGEDIPFQAFVWGPHVHGESEEEFHIHGVVGEANPEPGKFEVLLLGRWKLVVVMQITLRFRKELKDAWYSALNRYDSMTEIGEQIAAAAGAVLFTRARELSEVDTDSDDPEQVTRAITSFLNKIPEISGQILLALQKLGYDRLGGILPISVAISGVTPDKELQQLLQVEDEAKVKRYQQKLEGEAVLLRSRKLQEFMGELTEEQRRAFLALNAQEVQLRFANAGGESSSLEGLMRAFFAGQVKKITDLPQQSKPQENIDA